MQYCMTSSIRVRRDGIDLSLLPGQVVPVWNNTTGRWQEDVRVLRTSAVLREAEGGRLVAETHLGVRPTPDQAVPLEGPGFVKVVKRHASMPLIGDAPTWRSADGGPIARWRAVRSNDPEVMFWTMNTGINRVLAPGQWLLPALGTVTAEDKTGLGQACRLVGQDKGGYFTPLIPVIPDGPRLFLGLQENVDYTGALVRKAWEIQSQHLPKKLYMGWAFAGELNGLLNTVWPEAVPDSMPPCAGKHPVEFESWWRAQTSKLGDTSLAQAVESVTHVTRIDDDQFVTWDKTVAEGILAQEPVAV